MKHFFALVGVLLLVTAVAWPTKANEAEDVQSLVERAIATFKDHGSGKGPFVKGEL